MVPEVIGDWFDVLDLETEYKWIVLSIGIVSFGLAYLHERFFLPNIDDRF